MSLKYLGEKPWATACKVIEYEYYLTELTTAAYMHNWKQPASQWYVYASTIFFIAPRETRETFWR